MTPWFLSISLIITLLEQAIALPNIVLFLTDDEDVVLSEDYITTYNLMPTRDEIFKTNGIQFNNAFSSTPTCCVSRSSILTGKYVHNHGVMNNTSDGNCWGPDWKETHEPFTYARYLQDIGYNTFFAGKYLNRYSDASIIPRGWNDWHGLVGTIDYYNYYLSNNGENTYYDDSISDNYHTTVIKNFAMDFLTDHNQNYNDDTPFLLVLSTVAAHSPFTVEDKYLSELDEYEDEIIAPRTPNWNRVDNLDDHHGVISTQLEMTDMEIQESDYIFRHRLFTLKSVDDAIAEIYGYIQDEMSEDTLDNTYFLYTSDHGFHSGQFGMQFAKMQLYDTDIRVPFFMSNTGDNVYQGIKSDIMANNIDVAPTILDIAGIDYTIETEMDGKSLLPHIIIQDEDGEDIMDLEIETDSDDFSMFLVEYNGEGYNHYEYRMCDSRIDGFAPSQCDAWNNTFSCIRWVNNNNDDDFMYCNFKCFTEGRVETECDIDYNNIEAKGEYYNLNDDPWQMNNLWDTLTMEEIEYFNQKVVEFKACSGDECRELFNTNDIENNEEIADNDNSFLYDMSRLLAFITY